MSDHPTIGEPAVLDAELTVQKLRAWWAHRQGLNGSLAGASAAEVLTRTGWARSVGGSAPYLTLHARAGIDREAVDGAVSDVDICELPSARGCTYVLPARDFAIGLRVGAAAPEGELAQAVKHLGVSHTEIEDLCDAVVATCASSSEPLEPNALRKEVGDAARSLGEAGRKRGVSSTLPLALGLLQARGQLRRVPVDGRLDQQRFSYVAWSPSPLAATSMDAAAAYTELARRYFEWAAPATLAHFRWFSGLTAARAKQAIASLDLVPVGDDGLLLPVEHVDEFTSFAVPNEPEYALVALLDGLHLLHRDLSLLLDPQDAARAEPASTRGRSLGQLADPPAQLVVDRGRIVGFWEYDPNQQEIVAQLFVPRDDALDAAISRTQQFVADQLGDVRASSLDSPKRRAPLLAALR